jgi:N-methylhydantoinase A/oxoprolinase/acetone carboxylase beta subunit
LQEFVVAVRRALARRQIEAPLMVVRGDGTLMSADFAAATPVETIHSGPAASAIGGRFLSRLDEALVIDVGGTTTDIALVEGGEVAVNEEGARVDGYKTAVQAANLLSIPLGGDSHIHQSKEGNLAVGPERVVPLAYLAHRYPQVQAQLKTVFHRIRTLTSSEWLEYWFLLRDPGNEAAQTAGERDLLALLRQGPQPVPRILEQLKLFHPGQIEAGELWRREILGKAGLTPTDLLHVDGRYTPWCVEAAGVAVEIFYRFLYPSADELHRAVWRRMTEMVSGAVLTFLSQRAVPPPGRPSQADLGRWFFDNSLYDIHPHLESRLRLRLPVIGIGAAAEIVLAGMADVLHTELVLPPHHQVANAVGAVAGSVMVAEEVLVYPRLSEEGLEVFGYYVQGRDGRTRFGDLEAALAHARQLGREGALDAARRAGADNPQVTIAEIGSGLDTYRVRAEAVGNPRLAK